MRKREYYIENKESFLERSRKREQRMKDDPVFKLSKKCRELVRRTLSELNSSKSERSQEYLKYTSNELKEHLESLFLPGMNWNNHGTEWHIDHIYPVSKFIQEGIEDPAIINSLSNLRPMWKEDNISKKNKTFEEWSKLNPERAKLYT